MANNKQNDKGTDQFSKTIKKYLDEFAETDENFKVKYKNEKKNLKDCIQYILNTVKKKGAGGYTDGEIYGMALHYYDEEKINVGKAIDMTVKVNHHVELSDEEKENLREKARKKVIDEEMLRMRKKPIPKTKTEKFNAENKNLNKEKKEVKPQGKLF